MFDLHIFDMQSKLDSCLLMVQKLKLLKAEEDVSVNPDTENGRNHGEASGFHQPKQGKCPKRKFSETTKKNMTRV